ncbi:hypothetical protein [Erythrobacter aureus]|uniref:Uncharacterized protein n=1 Tax=Erythrobacter aureus TaxID=2182384 RepID=A0A345YIQ4_9SPHN|nr:hypothetical protein [Erythrobacter aureus]AXK43806.1 hypothetical protein DVR09_15230 [Erythrobacter aureus]
MIATDSKEFERLLCNTLIEKGLDPEVAASEADIISTIILPRMVEGDLVIEITDEPPREDRDDIQGIIVRDDIDEMAYVVPTPQHQPLIKAA